MCQRSWETQALQKIEADYKRSAETPLLKVKLPAISRIHLYLKDESAHITGSLKHRLARSLFLYGLSNGWIHHNTTIIEASSGSTAVSEAYFARLLGLPFIAVIPRQTSAKKIAQIQGYGGQCHFVEEPSQICSESRLLADRLHGHFMDQFTYAERATDWRGNNIAQAIYEQMHQATGDIPLWMVVSAGTGGTATTIGRHIRYHGVDTQLCVVDPENSVFYEYYQSGNRDVKTIDPSRIEGIGRPRVEPSFIREVIDGMIKVPDAASIAAIHFLEGLIGRKCGGSTGTNVYGTLQLIHAMARNGETGSLVTLINDSGDRYLDTYYNAAWLRNHGLHIHPYEAQLQHFYATGEWQDLRMDDYETPADCSAILV